PALLDELDELAVLPRHLLGQQPGVAEDAGERGADLVAHVREERALEAGHLLGRLARRDQLALELLPLRDVLPAVVHAGAAGGLARHAAGAVAHPPVLAVARDDAELEVGVPPLLQAAQHGAASARDSGWRRAMRSSKV